MTQVHLKSSDVWMGLVGKKNACNQQSNNTKQPATERKKSKVAVEVEKNKRNELSPQHSRAIPQRAQWLLFFSFFQLFEVCLSIESFFDCGGKKMHNVVSGAVQQPAQPATGS